MSTKKPPALPGRKRTRAATATAVRQPFGDLGADSRLRTVALDAIAPNRDQPRRHFDQDALEGLAASIAERGILQPPVVRELGEGAYELIAGERRCRAARIAGKTEIEVLLAEHDAAGAVVDALMENVTREGLTPLEIARGYARLIDEFGLTHQAVARMVGISRASVTNYIRLLDLPDAVLEYLEAGQLTFAHGKILLACEDHGLRWILASRAVEEGWSSRRLEQAIVEASAKPRPRPRAATADARAFATRYGDALSAATGMEIVTRVTAKGTVTLTLTDQDAARALADRLGVTPEALDEETLRSTP